MSILLLSARLLLAAVFLVAGCAKLADRTGSRRALIDFGVPRALVTPLGILLPLVELAVAVLLVPTVLAWWGALGAFALLLIFVAGIGTSLARGRSPDCHCFGQLHSAPVGWSTLLRNLVLAAIAGLVVWQGRYNADQSVVSILAALSIAQRIELIAGVVIIALLAVETLGLINVLNQQGKMLGRLKVVEAQLTTVSVAFLSAGAQLPDPTAAGLHVGNVAPDFRLSDLDGEVIALTSLLALGKPILLVFSDPSCGPCTGLLPEISRWQRDYASTLTIALLSWGSAEANRAKIAEYEVKHVLLLEQEVAETYQLKGTPSAVLIHTDGTIWSPMVLGTEAVRALMERIVELLISVLPVALANESSRNGTALL